MKVLKDKLQEVKKLLLGPLPLKHLEKVNKSLQKQ